MFKELGKLIGSLLYIALWLCWFPVVLVVGTVSGTIGIFYYSYQATSDNIDQLRDWWNQLI